MSRKGRRLRGRKAVAVGVEGLHPLATMLADYSLGRTLRHLAQGRLPQEPGALIFRSDIEALVAAAYDAGAAGEPKDEAVARLTEAALPALPPAPPDPAPPVRAGADDPEVVEADFDLDT